MTEKSDKMTVTDPLEALRAAEARGEVPTWEAINKALEAIESALEHVQGDNHILHVLAHAAMGDCSFERKRFAFALVHFSEHMDAGIKRLERDYVGVCNLAFERDQALAKV